MDKKRTVFILVLFSCFLSGILSGDMTLMSNLFFIAGISYLIWGLSKIIGRSGLFDRSAFGFSQFKTLFFNKESEISDMKNKTFEDFVKNKKKENSAKSIFLNAAILIVLSVIFAI